MSQGKGRLYIKKMKYLSSRARPHVHNGELALEPSGVCFSCWEGTGLFQVRWAYPVGCYG
jgi:hypothetical protein